MPIPSRGWSRDYSLLKFIERTMNPLNQNPYVQDILSQAESVKVALTNFDSTSLKPLIQSLQRTDFDRIVLTGMGSSLFASYPIWLQLINAGLPAYWIDCSELIHHASPMITKRTLVWITSQSGRSAEVVSLLEIVKQAAATILATVNDLKSPLADSASYRVPIHAEVEKTVSTRTYVNTLAVSQLAVLALTNGDIQKGLDELRTTAEGMADYFAGWETQLQTIGERVKRTPDLILLGRGPSLAAAYTGALILGEAAKVAAIGMQAGEFRHGPLELASNKLTVLLFAGSHGVQELNMRLYKDLKEADAHPVWITTPDNTHVEPQLFAPRAIGIGLPLAEIIPIQMLTIHMALKNGIEPGTFFRSGKVTLSE
jgi:glucosamine--fructose-6-phosphate aminotransferase (isomerizing)